MQPRIFGVHPHNIRVQRGSTRQHLLRRKDPMQFKRSAKLLGALLAALTLSVAAAAAQDNAPVTTQDNAPVTTQDSAPVKARRSETMAGTRTNLPAGTKVIVRLNSPLDSGTATQGQ